MTFQLSDFKTKEKLSENIDLQTEKLNLKDKGKRNIKA